MNADGVRVLSYRCWPPFAGSEHRGLVMFLNRRVAILAMVADATRIALLPNQARGRLARNYPDAVRSSQRILLSVLSASSTVARMTVLTSSPRLAAVQIRPSRLFQEFGIKFAWPANA